MLIKFDRNNDCVSHSLDSASTFFKKSTKLFGKRRKSWKIEAIKRYKEITKYLIILEAQECYKNDRKIANSI